MAGDALSILLFLGAAVLTFGVGAFTTNGWRSITLWVLFGVALIATGWWWFKPDLAPWITALLHSGALIMVFTVGTVALMVTGRQTASADQGAARAKPPSPAAETEDLSDWTPDTRLLDAAIYAGSASIWGRRDKPTVEEVRAALRTKLQSGEITAWARNHPDGPEFQVKVLAWIDGGAISPADDYAFSTRFGVGLHAIRTAFGQLKSAWPSPRGPPPPNYEPEADDD